jgi:hypothetical protein
MGLEMRKVSRMLVLACAGLAALALSSTAFAAYTPKMVVAGSNHALGGGGPVTFNITQVETDDPTFRMDLYSPLGYEVGLTATAGQQIGVASALVKVGALGGAKVPVTGTLNAANPQQHTSNQCSPGLHTAVWTITVTLAGTPVTVPVYVDRINSGPEAEFASARIRVCFNHPADRVRNPSGAQLLQVAFSTDVFTNPNTLGIYRWVGLFTPYGPTGVPNAAGSVQTQTVQRLPVQLGLTVKKVKRKGKTYALVSGTLRAGDQNVSRQTITLKRSTKSARSVKAFKTLRTNGKGRFSALVLVKKRTWFGASTFLPSRASAGCGAVAIAPCGTVVTAPVGTSARPLASRPTSVAVRP